jgi:hypothetical protein
VSLTMMFWSFIQRIPTRCIHDCTVHAMSTKKIDGFAIQKNLLVVF